MYAIQRTDPETGQRLLVTPRGDPTRLMSEAATFMFYDEAKDACGPDDVPIDLMARIMLATLAMGDGA